MKDQYSILEPGLKDYHRVQLYVETTEEVRYFEHSPQTGHLQEISKGHYVNELLAGHKVRAIAYSKFRPLWDHLGKKKEKYEPMQEYVHELQFPKPGLEVQEKVQIYLLKHLTIS
jgi:hypothetical protein